MLALYPPEVKPTNSFGFSLEDINSINTLLEQKHVVLYLFGNPYALTLFTYRKAAAIVIAYQDFNVFQNCAVEHFLQNINAKGELPINL